MTSLRRYLLAGLVVTIPAGITLYVLNVIYRLLRDTIGDPVRHYLAAHLPWVAIDRPVVAVLTGLLLTLAVLLGVGFVSSTMFGRQLVGLGERAVQATPLVGRIYAPARQVVQLLFATQKTAFREVVLVQYPHPGTYAVGFITAERFPEASLKTGQELVTVFVPFSPTPVTGIVLVLPRDRVIPLALTVEEAMKYVISGGVLTPGAELDGGADG